MVVDARDATGVANVSVRVEDSQQTAVTDGEGRFALAGVTAGPHELFVSAGDRGLARRTVRVEAGAVLDVRIDLAAGAGAFAEQVTVQADAVRRRDTAVAGEDALGRRDLMELRGVLMNDPLRAIQVLPAVAAGDDFRTEFSVRGGGTGQMNFTFEGVATPFLVHTVQQVRETGSLAMVNADVLEEVGLLTGAYPQRYGNRTGAELDFRMREGSRERVQSRVSLSAIDASAVTEGPLGPGARGSWLVSGRKSYLDLVVSHIYPSEQIAFGFSDAQAKVVYDVAARHQLQFAVTAGASRLDLPADTLDAGDFRTGENQSAVAVASWRYLPSPRFALTQRVAFVANDFANTTRDDLDLDRGRSHDVATRTEWTFAPSRRLGLEGGGEIRSSTMALRDQRFSAGLPQVRESFDVSTTTVSAYAQGRVKAGAVTIVPGMRIDRSGLAHRTIASPWVTGLWPLRAGLALRAGAGVSHQEPGFQEVAGLRGTAALRPQRAVDVDASIEGLIGSASRWQITLYRRDGHDLLRLPDSEPRVANGVLAQGSTASHYANAIEERARGIEALIEWRRPGNVTAWASYSYGTVRDQDVTTGEAFWADFDQRHGANMSAAYHVSGRVSVAARLRAGSNYPAPGYWTAAGARTVVGTERNTFRIPTYSRLDVRVNRSFSWPRARLTLFGEALNVYARTNMRVAAAHVNRQTLDVTNLLAPLAPFVPSAGLLIEF